MLKYTTTLVGFREVPNEISLCINISNCPLMCKSCHSPELREDIGTELTYTELESLLNANKGISCVCFLGGLNDIDYLNHLAAFIKETNNHLKTAVYLGCDTIPVNLFEYYWDYIKIGPYIEELGPLDSSTTNQRMYKITFNSEALEYDKEDITKLFWHET